MQGACTGAEGMETAWTPTRERTMGEHSDKAKGKFKQTVGIWTQDAKLKREGEKDEARGRAKGAVKDLGRAVKNLEKSAKKASRNK
jgi:uncharacterized protein YjbJ (UPF0337 family)